MRQALEANIQTASFPVGIADGCCYKNPEITDTEKTIYLKLVELAKAGKIEWSGRYGGKFGEFWVDISRDETNLYKTIGDNRLPVAYISHRPGQIAGDLYEIAKEQWKAQQAEMAAEFLQA